MRGAHVAFGIGSVVAVPVGDGGAGDADLEDLGVAEHGHAGHVAAVAPAVNADARGVDEAEARKVTDAGNLVLDLYRAGAVGEGGFEGEAAVGAAAVIELEDDEAFLGEVLGAEVDGERPLVCDALDVGSAVDRDDRGVTLAGLYVRRAVDRAVEERAVVRLEFDQLGGG